MIRTLTAVLILMMTVPAGAGAASPAWVSIGPSPPSVGAPLGVDAASKTVYIGTTGGGIFKSTDGGDTFAPANAGLGNPSIASMAVDPTNVDRVVVGTFSGGIYRTVDGGQNWTATSETAGTVGAMAVDPLNPQTFYCAFMGGAILKKSVNGGATWSTSNSGINAGALVTSIVADAHNSGVVYAATAGAGAFKSVNSGASWSPLSVQPVVWSLALDPNDSHVIYAGANGDGVFKSTDAGATFTRVGSPEVGVILSLVVDPTDSQEVYAATASGGVEFSTDGGATWKKTSIRKGLSIALSVTSEGQVFVGTGFNGAYALSSSKKDAFKSNGRHFVEIAGPELRAINAQNIVSVVLDPRDPQHILLGTNEGGLLGSTNGGATWIDSGEGYLSRAARRPVFDPNIVGRVYAGSFFGGGFYRSDDNGFTWSRHMVGSPGAYVWSAGVDPFSGSVYAGIQTSEGLWRSTDEGVTFARIDGGLIAQPRDIVFDPSTPGKVFIAAIGGLFRSLDGATTFTKVAIGGINNVTIDPTEPNVVYAATQTAGVLKSVDGGATFVRSNTGLVTTFSMGRGNGVVIDPTNTSILYVGTEGAGVFKSVDRGGSWFAINDGFTTLRIFGLALDPTQPNVLYAGSSSGGGVFKTVTGGQ